MSAVTNCQLLSALVTSTQSDYVDRGLMFKDGTLGRGPRQLIRSAVLTLGNMITPETDGSFAVNVE